MSAISSEPSFDMQRYNLADNYVRYSFNKEFDKFVQLLTEDVVMHQVTDCGPGPRTVHVYRGHDAVVTICNEKLFKNVSQLDEPQTEIHCENSKLWFKFNVIQIRNGIPVEFKETTTLSTEKQKGQLKIFMIVSEALCKDGK